MDEDAESVRQRLLDACISLQTERRRELVNLIWLADRVRDKQSLLATQRTLLSILESGSDEDRAKALEQAIAEVKRKLDEQGSDDD